LDIGYYLAAFFKSPKERKIDFFFFYLLTFKNCPKNADRMLLQIYQQEVHIEKYFAKVLNSA